MLYLPSPDQSRYVLYSKKPQRVANLDIKMGYILPREMTREDEQKLAMALTKAHYRYIEKELRKFMDDLNSLGGVV